MNSTRLLYVAFGREEIHLQATYSIYSALAWRNVEAEIDLYTDATAPYSDLLPHVRLHALTAERLRMWRGPGDFLFRIKVAAMADAAERDRNSKLIFVDADTFFVREVAALAERIDATTAVMHTREYHVGTNPKFQTLKFRRNLNRFRIDGQRLDLNVDMWNSGVVGLHPAQFGAIQYGLQLIDTVSPHYRKPFIDQYALASWLQKRFQMRACEDCIRHYWAQKAEYLREIVPRLGRWSGQPVEQALDEIRSNPITLPEREERTKLLELIWAWWQRVARRFADT